MNSNALSRQYKGIALQSDEGFSSSLAVTQQKTPRLQVLLLSPPPPPTVQTALHVPSAWEQGERLASTRSRAQQLN
jgi:hypothetical protein